MSFAAGSGSSPLWKVDMRNGDELDQGEVDYERYAGDEGGDAVLGEGDGAF